MNVSTTPVMRAYSHVCGSAESVPVCAHTESRSLNVAISAFNVCIIAFAIWLNVPASNEVVT